MVKEFKAENFFHFNANGKRHEIDVQKCVFPNPSRYITNLLKHRFLKMGFLPTNFRLLMYVSYSFKVGDRVWFGGCVTGSTAEYCLCNEDVLGQLPDAYSFVEGAMIGTPYMTAYRALFQK